MVAYPKTCAYQGMHSIGFRPENADEDLQPRRSSPPVGYSEAYKTVSSRFEVAPSNWKLIEPIQGATYTHPVSLLEFDP